MEEQIRLYSRAELECCGTEKIIDLFLERQEADVRILADYAENSRKLTNAYEEIRLLKTKLYGPLTESSSSLDISDTEDPVRQQRNADADKTDPGIRGIGNTEAKEWIRPRRKDGCMKQQRDGLPIIEVEDTIAEDKLQEVFGTGNISKLPPAGYDVIRMRPAFCYIERHNIHIYKSVKKIIRACAVEKLLPHSDISSSTMAYILNERFVMNLPANRICQELRRNGYPMNRQRVYYSDHRWCNSQRIYV